MFKQTAILASKKTEASSNTGDLISLLLNILSINYFYLALVIYGVATFYWLYLLQNIPLSIAYPFTALAMVIIPLVSYYFFREQLNDSYWAGAVLIVMGIVIISFSSKS
ncbi:EamA family transporter [Alphaproteobacteria bacterium]|nr:EamA family transporter [Alphaproteobacteria bacterium]